MKLGVTRGILYDPKCADLAQAFLSEVGMENDEMMVGKLAEMIQQSIENFFFDEGLDK